jgi:hypothetical protein
MDALVLSHLGIRNYINQRKNFPVDPQNSGFSLCTAYPSLAQFSLLLHDNCTIETRRSTPHGNSQYQK